ncbi:uncharacterized protein LOC126252960 [Schistocerca nitens]|uniref:uncharacterized protein LOC126252960 n=1 Tax=Schistocerca nitens TaxID=7011 RepID=UPI0021196531|nr:uncharacterized protein LOC126252960 [Schistocerca nitens]
MNVLELMNSMMETDGGADDDRRASRLSTRDSTISTSQSISMRQSEDEVQRRSMRAIDSETGPTHHRSKNMGISVNSGLAHSNADVETLSRRQSLRSRKGAADRRHSDERRRK